MRALIFSTTLVAALMACQSEPSRFTSAEDACSFSELDGWKAERQKGSLLLRDGSGATIAIRSVPATGDWVEPRTPELVNPAVRKVLDALPEAELSGPTPVRSGLDGAQFEATFQPAGKERRYLRKHVVLYGQESDRVFHVVLTAPEDEAEKGSKAFERVVDSFREEV